MHLRPSKISYLFPPPSSFSLYPHALFLSPLVVVYSLEPLAEAPCFDWPLMAADVTSILQILEESEGKRSGLFTRNLLGGAATSGDLGSSKELDLDLQVPSGWERRLDLMSGKTYLHRLDSDLPFCETHDLNLPPPAAYALPEDSDLLDLKLAGGLVGGVGEIRGEYQSVCTLEKVRSALERAGRATASVSASVSPSSSTTSTSMKRRTAAEDEDGGWDSAGEMMAAACPSCLLYVLISKGHRRCPGCDSHVPIPFMPKKPRFDLKSS